MLWISEKLQPFRQRPFWFVQVSRRGIVSRTSDVLHDLVAGTYCFPIASARILSGKIASYIRLDPHRIAATCRFVAWGSAVNWNLCNEGRIIAFAIYTKNVMIFSKNKSIMVAPFLNRSIFTMLGSFRMSDFPHRWPAPSALPPLGYCRGKLLLYLSLGWALVTLLHGGASSRSVVIPATSLYYSVCKFC